MSDLNYRDLDNWITGHYGEDYWKDGDLEVGQCRGCGAAVEEEHAPGCPDLQADLVDRAYERGRELDDLTPITRRCLEPRDEREWR
jgi:hypothetical protein